MITPITEYYANLSRIQSENKKTLAILLPSSEPVLEIDLESRVIETPNFISIAEDHRAETIFFSVNRYFGNVDLSNLAIVIQYINVDGESRLYPIEFIDVTTLRNEQKMLFPWMIGDEATKKAGILNFSVCFYDIDVHTNEFNYCLNTLPASTYILEGLGMTASPEYVENMTVLPGYADSVEEGKMTLEALAARIAKMEQDTTVYWEYATAIPSEMLPPEEEEDIPSEEPEEETLETEEPTLPTEPESTPNEEEDVETPNGEISSEEEEDTTETPDNDEEENLSDTETSPEEDITETNPPSETEEESQVEENVTVENEDDTTIETEENEETPQENLEV